MQPLFLQRSLIETSLAKQNPAKSSIHYIHLKLFTSNKVTSFRKMIITFWHYFCNFATEMEKISFLTDNSIYIIRYRKK